jgi:hypothetical protein
VFRISSESDLLRTFRPRDRRVFQPPAKVTYPLYVRDYLAWPDPAGGRVFVVFPEPTTGNALGLAFRDDTGDTTSSLCEWCHSPGKPNQVALLMCEKSSKRSIGTWLCRDLACGTRVENAADLAGRNGVDARKAVLERMWRFAHEGLGIERVPND